MKAECRCSPNSGTCCRACRAASELMVIALRVEELAPEHSEKIRACAAALQRDLVADRVLKTQRFEARIQ